MITERIGRGNSLFVCLFVYYSLGYVTQAMNITLDTLEKLNPNVQESKAPLTNCKNISPSTPASILYHIC